MKRWLERRRNWKQFKRRIKDGSPLVMVQDRRVLTDAEIEELQRGEA